jgi:hypothetical protein
MGVATGFGSADRMRMSGSPILIQFSGHPLPAALLNARHRFLHGVDVHVHSGELAGAAPRGIVTGYSWTEIELSLSRNVA